MREGQRPHVLLGCRLERGVWQVWVAGVHPAGLEGVSFSSSVPHRYSRSGAQQNFVNLKWYVSVGVLYPTRHLNFEL